MASLCYLTAVVFFVCCSTATVGKRNATFQPRNNTVVGRRLEALNRTNNSTGCNLVVEKSKIEEILSKHDKSTTTNVVNLKVSIYPGKKTRYFQELELPWASEIGRTIISLVRRARDIKIFSSPVFTWSLEVGTKKVDIEVMEETDGCLPPGKEGTDQIFDFLLHKLSRSEDKHVFKLCRIHKDKSIKFATYHCCRIAGEKNLTICANYSSAVVKWALPVIIVISVVAVLFVLPSVVQYITTYPTTDSECYKASESHMSLMFLVSNMFCKGRGVVKSFSRRCVFAVLTLVPLLPDFWGIPCYGIIIIVLFIIIFISYNDIQMTSAENKKICVRNICKKKCTDEESKKKCEYERTCVKKCEGTCLRPQWDTDIISCFTIPFGLAYDFFNWAFEKMIEKEKEEEQKKCSDRFCYLICAFILFIVLTIAAPIIVIISLIICLVKFFFFNFLGLFVCPHHCRPKLIWLADIFVRFVAFFMSAFFTGMTFIVVLSTVVGLALNAEFFNPFIALIITIIIYFWKDWRSSVEGKCFQLKTLIIEVCEEKSQTPENKSTPENEEMKLKAILKATEGQKKDELKAIYWNRFLDFLFSCVRNNDRHTWQCQCPCLRDEQPNKNSNIDIIRIESENFVIEFDEHDEAMIPITLYEKVENIILPLDNLLFFFFRRVIFVFLYAICLFIVMIAFRESGISESVRLISTIAGVIIPFIFDTIFADDHFLQKNFRIAATKGKLKRILKAEKKENGTIFVEVMNTRNNVKSQQNLRNESGNNGGESQQDQGNESDNNGGESQQDQGNESDNNGDENQQKGGNRELAVYLLNRQA